MSKKALYAGSFDPITNGHLDIIRRAAKMYDELFVGITVNNDKKPLFTLEERSKMVKRVVRDIDNVKIVTFDGLLADFANNKKFDAVIRGLRATTDFEHEIQMAQMNARLFTGETETIFLMTDPKFSFISSSLIKEVASLEGDVTELLPEYANEMLKAKF